MVRVEAANSVVASPPASEADPAAVTVTRTFQLGRTGIARLCLVHCYYQMRTGCLLSQEEAPDSISGGSCHLMREFII